MFTMKLIGQQAIINEVAAMQAKIRKTVLRDVVKEVGAMVAEAARPLARKQSGVLAQSIGVSNVKVYQGTEKQTGHLGTSGPAEVVYAAVGPRRGFARVVVKTRSGRLKALGKKSVRYEKKSSNTRGFARAAVAGELRDPSDYGHLVELGHRIARGGSLERLGKGHSQVWRRHKHVEATGHSTGFVPAYPFMAPTAALAKQAQQMAESRIGAAIAETNARLK
jgi:hypothetical protein